MANETVTNGCLESPHPTSSNDTIVLTQQKEVQENDDKERNSCSYKNFVEKFCFLNETLLAVFSTVGAVRRVYNVHEVLELLEKYLLKNKSLIDPLDPKFILCANTDLGRAFGVDKFEYKDVGKLLAKNVTAVNSNGAPPGSKNFALNTNQYDAGHSNCSDPIRICTTSDTFVTITCASNSFASVPSTSHSSSLNFRKLNTSVKIPVPEIPGCLPGPESEYSYQGYETSVIEDSDSEIEQKSVHSAQEEVEEEEEEVEEYELASESEPDLKSQNDTESDFENIVLIFGVEEREDSDEDCFADHSSSSSSSDSEGHSTEDEKDQWSCVTCGIKNKPFVRYCQKCWQLRKDWYPEPPKRLRKRKPRMKKDKKRFSCESDEKTNSKDEIVNKDCKGELVNEDCKEGVVNEDSTEEVDLLEKLKEVSSKTQRVELQENTSSPEDCKEQEVNVLNKSRELSSNTQNVELQENSSSLENGKEEEVNVLNKLRELSSKTQKVKELQENFTSPEDGKKEEIYESLTEEEVSVQNKLRTFSSKTQRVKELQKNISSPGDGKKEEINGSHTEEEVNEDGTETSSDTLMRTSSTASTSTVTSACSLSSASSSMASSQDSGFGSQELSSYDLFISRKRKASESEEGKRKTQKTVDDVEETADKLAKKLKKFSKTSKGIRWLKSDAARELLELMQDTSSDSDCEPGDVSDVCPLCYSRPKDASIIHGRLSHIGFCYPCAKRLYNSKSKCPICRRKIHMITKNVYV